MAGEMRQPTTPEDAYRWYREALEASRDHLPSPPIDENDPRPGFYKRRFDSAGVFVPGRIWLVQFTLDGELIADERVACEIGGERFEPLEVWLYLCQHPITKAEFDHLMRVRDWAQTYRRDQPEAHPTKAVDFFTVAAPTWGTTKRKNAK